MSGKATASVASCRPAALRQPRIGIILWRGDLGGAEAFSAELARALRARGVDITVLFVTTGGPLTRRLEGWGIPWFALARNRGRDVLADMRGLAREASAVGRDAVITCTSGWLCGALRAGGYGGRLVAVEHGTLVGFGVEPSGRASRALHRGKGLVDGWLGQWAVDDLVAVSDLVGTRLRARRPKRPISRIYCGVDVDLYRPAIRTNRHDVRRFVVMSRLVPGKGLEVLIEAVRVTRLGDVQLDIWGDGPDRPSLERQIKDLGLADRVRLRGRTDQPHLVWPEYDVAIAPSNEGQESFGRTAVEAMACGLPVIAAANGGLVEAVQHEVTGILVPRGSVQALADAMSRYYADAETARDHGRAGQVRAESAFSIDRAANEYLTLMRVPHP